MAIDSVGQKTDVILIDWHYPKLIYRIVIEIQSQDFYDDYHTISFGSRWVLGFDPISNPKPNVTQIQNIIIYILVQKSTKKNFLGLKI